MMECTEVEPNMLRTTINSSTLLRNAINCVMKMKINLILILVNAKASHFQTLVYAHSTITESAHNQLLQLQEPITMPEQLILSNPTETLIDVLTSTLGKRMPSKLLLVKRRASEMELLTHVLLLEETAMS
jgi:hypothetical protein